MHHIEPLVPPAPNVSSDRRDAIVFHTDPVVWPESLLPPGEKLVPPRNEPSRVRPYAPATVGMPPDRFHGPESKRGEQPGTREGG